MECKKLRIIILIVGIGLSSLSACKPWGNVYLNTEVSGQITVTNEWKEIVFDKPYKPVKNQQSLCLVFAEPVVEVPKEWHPRLKDGRKLIFEIKIVDLQGNLFTFNKIESLNTEQTCFTAEDKEFNTIFPPNRTLIKMKLKSNVPVSLNRIYWHSYNIQDLK
jgi:hypothetical protein